MTHIRKHTGSFLPASPLTATNYLFIQDKFHKMDRAWLWVERGRLLQPLYGAEEFFISEQLGHKWPQSHLNIV